MSPPGWIGAVIVRAFACSSASLMWVSLLLKRRNVMMNYFVRDILSCWMIVCILRTTQFFSGGRVDMFVDVHYCVQVVRFKMETVASILSYVRKIYFTQQESRKYLLFILERVLYQFSVMFFRLSIIFR